MPIPRQPKFTAASNWKQPTYGSEGERINKPRRTHTVEYYSALPKSEPLIPTTTWINLLTIMLTERSQTKKCTQVYGSII